MWTPVSTVGSDGTQLVQLVHYDGTLQHGEILALEGCRNLVDLLSHFQYEILVTK